MVKAKIEIPRLTLEIILQALSGLVILYVSFLIVIRYGDLPDTIPTHYNAFGEVVGWGNKSTILLLYGVNLVMYIGLTILERYPQLYNYPVQITENNIRIQYLLARILITSLKLGMTCIFTLIIASAFRDQTENTTILLGNYFLIFVMGINFLPIIIYFILSFKNK